MKKQILLLLMFMFAMSSYGQINNPAPQPRGIETPYIIPIKKTTTQLNALGLNESGKGVKAYNSTLDYWVEWDGDSWEASSSGGGGSTTPATVGEINTGTDNTKMVTPLGLAGSDYFTKTQNDTYYKPIGYVPAWAEITGKPTFFTPSFSGLATNDMLQWDGTNWVNKTIASLFLVNRTATNYMVSGSVLDFQVGSTLRAFSRPRFYDGITFNNTNLLVTADASKDDYVLKYNHATQTIDLEPESTGGGLANIVEDTTPQLGGNLDVNTKSIISNSDLNFDLDNDNNSTSGTLSVTSNNGTKNFLRIIDSDVAPTVLFGTNDTTSSSVAIYGNNAVAGGSLTLYNAASEDTNSEFFSLLMDYDFKIYNGTSTEVLNIDDVTSGITAPATSIADITTLGAKALITKEYADANYTGGSGHTIQDNGVSKTARTNLNFKNFVVDDNAANNSTDITAVVAGAPLTYNYTAVGSETSINTGVSIASNYQTEIYYGNAVLSPTIDYTLSYGATTTINFTFPLEAGYPIRVVYNSSSAPNAITDTDDVPEGTTNLYADANATNQGNTFNGANQLVKLDGTGKLPAIDGSNLTNLPSGGSGITSVVEDTTPQLGGNLDVNGNSIDSSGDMTFNAIGNDIIFNGLIVGNDGIYVAGSSSIFNNIQALGDVNFTDYGSGTKTGTATYNLAIDTNGNVIETALGGGGDMLKSENLSGLTNYSTARSNLGLVIGTNVLAPNGSASGLTGFPTLNQNTTGSAATLTTPRTINGTSFNGSANITTTNWGTSRNISIGGTSKAVTGGANVTWTQSEIGVNKTTIDALGINATTTTTSTSTGTAIDMGYKRQMNFGAASSASTFTLTNIAVGGYAEVLINGTTEPTVTGATKLPDTASWVTGTNMVLCVKDFNGTRKYWFVKF